VMRNLFHRAAVHGLPARLSMSGVYVEPDHSGYARTLTALRLVGAAVETVDIIGGGVARRTLKAICYQGIQFAGTVIENGRAS